MKEPILMLGNEEVLITSALEEPKNNSKKEVWTRKGSVTVEEWKTWYERFNTGLKLNMDGFKLDIGKYRSTYNSPRLDIGCIENVTVQQLDAINKTIKNLRIK